MLSLAKLEQALRVYNLIELDVQHDTAKVITKIAISLRVSRASYPLRLGKILTNTVAKNLAVTQIITQSMCPLKTTKFLPSVIECASCVAPAVYLL